MVRMGVFVAVIMLSGGVALADREAFGGFDVRTDLGTQLVRAGGGVRVGGLALNLVVDPYGYHSGEQHDTDAFAEWDLSPGGWAVLGGWRVSSLPLVGVRYYQEKLLLGLSAPLTALPLRHLRPRFGAEWALTVVRHGGDLPTFWVWHEDELHGGSFNLGVFLRVHLGGAI
jgi:hypothetical protein